MSQRFKDSGGTEAVVAELPNCDLCGGETRPAAYDAKTKMGPWAYLCEPHFTVVGVGLGEGRGQRLHHRHRSYRMTTTTDRIVSASDVLALAGIVNAAHSSARVARITPERGELVYATARAICADPEGRGFAHNDRDVRDCWLWVTTRSGWEMFWPISELIDEHKAMTFTAYDWSKDA